MVNTSMRIHEIILESSFHGRTCKKNCEGHSAGYQWGMRHKGKSACDSHSDSFVAGCEIANKQIHTNTITKPRIRSDRSRYVPARVAKKKTRM